jgi:hypothetical protein
VSPNFTTSLASCRINSIQKQWRFVEMRRHSSRSSVLQPARIVSNSGRPSNAWFKVFLGSNAPNISLNLSRLLLTNGVLQGAVLITADSSPRVEFLLVDASLNHVEVGSFLLTAALEPLQASGVQQVTARVHKDDNELFSLLERFGFAASNRTVPAPHPPEP